MGCHFHDQVTKAYDFHLASILILLFDFQIQKQNAMSEGPIPQGIN